LLRNNGQKFISRNVHLKAQTNNTLITNNLSLTQAYKIPIAHADGRYFADANTIQSLYENDQILFKYCDAAGNVTDESNPNGSLENIAGICSASRHVFGMMPHPERAADAALGNTDGLVILEQLRQVLV
jgi:phosphoribosylformylglycinamidine synthase subunit PurQ / glutaminase